MLFSKTQSKLFSLVVQNTISSKLYWRRNGISRRFDKSRQVTPFRIKSNDTAEVASRVYQKEKESNAESRKKGKVAFPKSSVHRIYDYLAIESRKRENHFQF